ncbi:hypothetical protein A4R35_00560 [Thermogemmatispora tikiterensis]|uniref:DNA replication and repair protein RecF n=2 Tax=Thermogemmatispora tikiterensis TaxID=1825093 RepID=A0A328VDG1_9CHLR|nr:hypothetical protein A4R35_00560 [Thermogemmatispora tikiterensis]
MVLSTYRDALTRQKLRELEKKLIQYFAQLCHKEDLLTQVLIDPETFAVQFRDVHGRLLSLASFSAGERQLYALALLQALRAIGQRRLSLVMDTPLALLDEEYRQRFLRE